MNSFIFNIQRFSLHDGPGIRTSIFYKGCPLRCAWCSNPESQLQTIEPIWDNIRKGYVDSGYHINNEDLLKEIMKDVDFYEESNGGVTVTGGEVLNQIDAVVDLLAKCQENNIHTACETSGYSSKENFIKLMNSVDLFIMDIKHHDTDMHFKETNVHLQRILDNARLLANSEINYLIRIPVIPNYNDSIYDAMEFAKLLKNLNINKVELLPFHQFGEEKYKYLNREYQYSKVKSYYREDLLQYIKVMENEGLEVICK